jgi:hypothetical protein
MNLLIGLPTNMDNRILDRHLLVVMLNGIWRVSDFDMGECRGTNESDREL